MWTVQAPHWAMPQPYLVPVRPTFSRIAQSSGVLGSTSTSYALPLMVRRAIRLLLDDRVVAASTARSTGPDAGSLAWIGSNQQSAPAANRTGRAVLPDGRCRLGRACPTKRSGGLLGRRSSGLRRCSD